MAEQLPMSGAVNIYGPSGSLKSSMGLTWPGPLTIWDFDFGLHRAHGMRVEGERWLYCGEQVQVYRGAIPVRSLTERYGRLTGFRDWWVGFATEFNRVCEGEARTLIVDTGTVLWGLVCDAYLEEIQQSSPNRKQLQQLEYGEPNRRMHSLFAQAKSYGKNLVIINHETAEYIPYVVNGRQQMDDQGNPKSVATGRMVPDGWRRQHLEPKLDWNLHMVAREERSKVSDEIVVEATIEKSGAGIELVGARVGGLASEGMEKEHAVYPTYQELVKMLKALGKL